MKYKFPIEVYNEDFYSKNNVFRLLAYIVDKCNYNCEYCYNVFPRTNKIIDLDKLYSFIYDVIFKNGKEFLHLDLIGGETTLHPDLFNFCLKIQNDKNIYTTIYSNFSKPIEYYKQLLKTNVILLLSWHSVCNTEDFKKKFALFTDYELKNIIVSIMFEHNASDKSILIFDYMSSTYPNLQTLEFSILDENKNYNRYKYTNELMKLFNSRSYKTKTPTTLIKYSDKSYEYVNDNYFFRDVKNANFKHWICNAGIDFLYIYLDGTVHPCDENDKTVLFNINNSNNFSKFKIPNKPIFCKREHCPCLFDLYKKKVF